VCVGWHARTHAYVCCVRAGCVRACVCVRVCMCARRFMCVCVRVRACVRACMRVCVSSCTLLYESVRVCVDVFCFHVCACRCFLFPLVRLCVCEQHVHKHTHTCSHAHINTRTQTHTHVTPIHINKYLGHDSLGTSVLAAFMCMYMGVVLWLISGYEKQGARMTWVTIAMHVNVRVY